MDDGDRSAADALIEHRGFVRALARSLVSGGDLEAGDDLAHDAFVAGLAQPPRCERAWRSWLRATVRNLAANLVRTKTRGDARERTAAQPEALPSTAALVERLELEQRVVAAVLTLPEPERAVVLLHFYDGQATAAIATRLGAPPDTVRARMRRALARLRGQLDRDYGDRGSWMRGLAPLAGWKAATTVATLGGATVGTMTLSSKLVTATVAAAALVASTWVALPDGWLRDPLRGERGLLAAAAPGDRAGPAAASSDGVTALPAPARTEVAPVPGETADAPPAELPPPGQVAFRVIDGETRAPIDAVTIRFLNETRFAQYDGRGEATAKLTSGHWVGRVTAAGCEPIETATFDVIAGLVTELGNVELVHGGARIEGRVTARGAGDRGVTVELHGAGRSPCAKCRAARASAADAEEVELADHPERAVPIYADCGYGDDRSHVEIAAGGTFRFDDLAAGTYWIRAIAADAKLVASRRVDVDRNGSVWVDLDLGLPTSLALELRHANGHHFTGDWAQPHSESPAPIRFVVSLANLGAAAKGQAHAQPTADDVRATMGPPIPAGEGAAPVARELVAHAQLLEERMLYAEVLEQRVQAESQLRVLHDLPILGEFFKRDRIDRARESGDALIADPAAPKMECVELTAERQRADLFVLAPLPRELVTIQVECGHYQSAPVDVDLRYGFTGPMAVTLLPPDPEHDGSLHAAPLSVSSKACIGCHDGAVPAPGECSLSREER